MTKFHGTSDFDRGRLVVALPGTTSTNNVVKLLRLAADELETSTASAVERITLSFAADDNDEEVALVLDYKPKALGPQ